jgi:hypothetical protein
MFVPFPVCNVKQLGKETTSNLSDLYLSDSKHWLLVLVSKFPVVLLCHAWLLHD